MKDKTKRLKFKGSKKVETENYRVIWNTNEDEETLDIAIHRKDGKMDRTFAYAINNFDAIDIAIGNEDIVKKSIKGGGNEAIYQISVPFDNIDTKDNIVIIYDTTAGIATITSIEFFAETEDNFAKVKLQIPGTEPTKDQVLWDAIDTDNLFFKEYAKFIDSIICIDDPVNGKGFIREDAKKRSPFIKSDEYNIIKFATDFYMMKKLRLDKNLIGYSVGGALPYFDLIEDRLKDDTGMKKALEGDCLINENDRINKPVLIELIWNYWMEQGMLVQTLNVINLRFQNIKGNFYSDRLQRFNADPLRKLSYILWGYIQDEQHRLSIPRRLNEYDHEYGLTLTGKAVPRINPVDSRVKFLEAFHSLLTLCTIYFRESDDTTRIADAFPILNSLKEVHLLLAEGNHNAYGNLTWTARQEMLMQQYILSRTEMREFLGGRTMVPYPESWMDRVDTMRNIQGWGGTGIVHYSELATHGELILLSIRYGNWSDLKLDRNNAANWAQRFRNSVQRYIHAYRSVTGIDMSVDQIMQLPANYAIQPAYLIQQRMLDERSRTRRA